MLSCCIFFIFEIAFLNLKKCIELSFQIAKLRDIDCWYNIKQCSIYSKWHNASKMSLSYAIYRKTLPFSLTPLGTLIKRSFLTFIVLEILQILPTNRRKASKLNKVEKIKMFRLHRTKTTSQTITMITTMAVVCSSQ